jgi:hypothetical protein
MLGDEPAAPSPWVLSVCEGGEAGVDEVGGAAGGNAQTFAS